MKRRDFIHLVGSGMLASPFLTTNPFASESSRVAFLSAQDDFQGRHFIAGIDHNGNKLFSLEIPERAHGMAQNPANPNQVVYVARRPGMELHAVDLSTATISKRIHSAEGRHFYGHAYFTRDGQYLLTCENNFVDRTGVIVVRDAQTLQVLQEYPSYGIGPHEIHLLNKSNTLVIANGGIITHPDLPRVKLNVDTMQPSLTYIDLANGDLLAEYRLQNHHNGIRHIDVNHDDRVMLVMQFEGKDYSGAMVAAHHGEDELRLFADDGYAWDNLNRYCGSVAFNADSNIAAVSSPRGNRLLLCDAAAGEVIGAATIPDVCGVTYDKRHQSFVATNGAGGIFRLRQQDQDISVEKISAVDNTRWDNHLLAV